MGKTWEHLLLILATLSLHLSTRQCLVCAIHRPVLLRLYTAETGETAASSLIGQHGRSAVEGDQLSGCARRKRDDKRQILSLNKIQFNVHGREWTNGPFCQLWRKWRHHYISIDWENILSELLEEEIIFGKYIEKDTKEDQILSTNRRLARPLNQTPLLQGYCRALWNKWWWYENFLVHFRNELNLLDPLKYKIQKKH